jgi:O-antigen/teichoic acid export membrane protein
MEVESAAIAPPTQPPPAPGPARGGGMDRTLGTVRRGTAVMISATIVLVLLQFVTRVVIIRHITAAQWGEFNLGLALANFLALVAAFGIPTATARSMAFEETVAERLRLVRIAISVSLPVAVGSSAVIYFAAPSLAAAFHTASLAPVFQLFALSIGFTILSNVLVGIFQGLERAEPNAVFLQIVNPILFFVFAGVFIFSGAGFTGVLIGYVLSWAFVFGALAVYSYRSLPRLLHALSADRFTGDPTARVSFLAMTITLFGVTTLTFLTSYADTLLLGLFRSDVIVGQYSSAMNLTRLLLVGTGTVTFVYLPATSRLRRERDFEGIRRTFVTVTRWMIILTIPLTFLFVFDPVFSLAFAFGSNQTGGAAALQLLVAASTVAILFGPSTSTLGGLGKTRSVLRYTVISTIANVALCFLLIPPYGMMGAAIAWAVARLLFPGLSLLEIYLELGISPFSRRALLPLGLSAAILIPVFYFLRVHLTLWWLPVLVLLPVVVYGAMVLATRNVDPGDVYFVRAAERHIPRLLRPVRELMERRLVPGEPPAKLDPLREGAA